MDRTDRRARVALACGVALVAGATGAAFGRLFVGSESAARLALAGVAAVALAVLLERRHVLIALALSAIGCVTFLGISLFADTTFLGVPTPETLRTIGRALSDVGRHAAREFTPAGPLPSLVGASMIAVWCASFAAHVLAARAGAPVIALVPLAGLLAFAGILAEDGARFGYDAAFLAGALLTLYGTGLVRLGRWGPVLAKGSGLTVAARHARWLGAAALTVALVAPGILPGLRAEGTIDVRGEADRGRLGVSPIVDIRPVLLSDPDVELFRVRSARPAYWRLTSLERFDGRLWSSADLSAKNGREVIGRAGLPGARRAPTSSHLVQDFELLGLDPDWLPTAYRPTSVTLEQPARFDDGRGSLVPVEEIGPRFRYRVTSELLAPSPTELRRVESGPRLREEETALPRSLPRRIHDIALEITGEAPNQYDQMLALTRHLRSFTYDQSAPAGHGGNDILFFLEESRRGYCEQFAAAMAVLARTLGYGARVAIGFTPGDRLEDGSYRVTTKHAHAWTEIYFPGYGWLAFEPTPTRSNPVAVDYADPAAAVESGGETVSPPDARSSLSEQEIASAAAQRESVEADDVIPQPPLPAPTAEEPGGPPWALVPVAVALLFGGLLAVRLGRRRLRVARARSEQERILAAYRGFLESAADVGVTRRAGETSHEYARRVRATIDLSDGHLDRLTGLASAALYSRSPSDGDLGWEAARAARVASRDVRKGAGPIRYLAGSLGLPVGELSPRPGPDASPRGGRGRTDRGRSGTR